MAFRQDDPLTAMSATDLHALLVRREVSAEDAARAHLDRIITLDGRVNAFVAVLRGDALEAARTIDEQRARGADVGPLAGLPVTVKENLDFEGRAATLGIVARKSKIAKRDATIVRALKRGGAVILGQTNVPQLLLSHETRNPVYGATSNVFSRDHAPGGSSGGEASAIGAGMSPAGVGTDIGGSIRVPATWSGIAGFKPTLDRWSNRGSNGSMPGQEAVRSQTGPMARSVRDLVLLLCNIDVVAMAADDPLVPPMPFSDPAEIDPKTLRVGYYVDDGLVTPSAAVGRAVMEAALALRERGVETKPFSPPRMRDAMGLYFGLMSADGGKTAWGQLDGTAIEPTLLPLRRMAALPDAVRSTLIRVLRATGEERPSWLLSQLGEKSVQRLWQLTLAARAYRLEVLEAMQAAQVDVLLCPAHATPAVPHTASAQFQIGGSYSMLFNLLQFPAGVVPVTTVRPSERVRAGEPQDRFERVAAAVDEKSAGLPVGVQVVGRPFADERALAVMLALEAAVEGTAGRPYVPRSPA
jgi:fatty acid amide hydrolase